MDEQHLFTFKTDLAGIAIPEFLNNPFADEVSEIASVAAKEFQSYIIASSKDWGHDFLIQKGKMFGVLVVQTNHKTYAYLGAVSGKLLGSKKDERLVPSVFDEGTDDNFIGKGMTELTKIGAQIKGSTDPIEIDRLSEFRSLKSHALQEWLFRNYVFLNVDGKALDVLDIFENSMQGYPPSAAGECAAPKLLHYAFKHKLKPIAIAEFWWGKPPMNKEKEHGSFYPACRDKCRPILEYMLDDTELYDRAN